MSDSGEFNLCACILSQLRATVSQEICTETECYTPDSLPGPGNDAPVDPNNFMMFFMVAMIGMFLYMLRPKSLRMIGGNGKGADSDSDFSGEPPFPPPAVN
ncbi:uncharacterized protein LOC106641321 [Copidosoma floridanum]|uniref:uncharacterized protein LOC106641321 n=1 Tax=Copidosoma floridanum TaxID=29053 RepID=UPI0006C97DB1|nr:uncharacterized protein LOC106641321 [Copidosoma floridanum]XP_014211203.1 uncharacterized protein LOC106641321 [Copidosoma floridanum]XP_014211204.1 uncharacterized protein LOC106641321 [Copidosoma floridanum]XP_014211205.1 uncharacterized protein LOC106641321 [Copidosoma floridanum]